MVIEKVGSVIFMIDFLWNTHTHTYTNAYACTTIGCAYVERGRRERKLALSS